MTDKTLNEESIPFYPDHVRTEFKVVLGILAVVVAIGVIGLFSPVGLGEPADPLNTPLHVKPEWYFLALYQILKFVSKTAGVIIPMVFLVIVMFWPFFDRKPETSKRVQQIRFIVVTVGLVILIALTVWGEVS